MRLRRARLGGHILVVIGVGSVFCCSGFLKGGIEGFATAREDSTRKFGASAAKRLEDLLRTRDDARLARPGDPASLAIVRRGRERAEALCGSAAKVEFLRATDQNRARYSRAERYFDCDVRLTGPRGTALARLRYVHDEDRGKWPLVQFDVESTPEMSASRADAPP